MGIKEKREMLGISQTELADLLSVTRSAVCQWETGRTIPRGKRLRLLSLILQCTEEELCQGA